jgi:hypothetical protein
MDLDQNYNGHLSKTGFSPRGRVEENISFKTSFVIVGEGEGDGGHE